LFRDRIFRGNAPRDAWLGRFSETAGGGCTVAWTGDNREMTDLIAAAYATIILPLCDLCAMAPLR